MLMEFHVSLTYLRQLLCASEKKIHIPFGLSVKEIQGRIVTFEVDNENSRNTPPNPHVLLRDVNQEQSQGDRLVALSDKL